MKLIVVPILAALMFVTNACKERKEAAKTLGTNTTSQQCTMSLSSSGDAVVVDHKCACSQADHNRLLGVTCKPNEKAIGNLGCYQGEFSLQCLYARGGSTGSNRPARNVPAIEDIDAVDKQGTSIYAESFNRNNGFCRASCPFQRLTSGRSYVYPPISTFEVEGKTLETCISTDIEDSNTNIGVSCLLKCGSNEVKSVAQATWVMGENARPEATYIPGNLSELGKAYASCKAYVVYEGKAPVEVTKVK